MTDDERTARIGRNEAIFREVNERIDDLNRGMASVSDGMLHIVCECGNRDCVEQLAVTPDEYEQVRKDPTHFIVKRGHEIPDTVDVVAERDTYLVVRQRPGLAGEIARQTDPRS